MEEEKDTIPILKKLKKLRTPGGAFATKYLKHGGSPKVIAATAARQLINLMNDKKVNELTFKRKNLTELFGRGAVKPPKGGRSPTLKSSVLEHLRGRGIKVRHWGGFVDFIRIEPKKYPI